VPSLLSAVDSAVARRNCCYQVVANAIASSQQVADWRAQLNTTSRVCLIAVLVTAGLTVSSVTRALPSNALDYPQVFLAQFEVPCQEQSLGRQCAADDRCRRDRDHCDPDSQWPPLGWGRHKYKPVSARVAAARAVRRRRVRPVGRHSIRRRDRHAVARRADRARRARAAHAADG
jgi:hypothetical protein